MDHVAFASELFPPKLLSSRGTEHQIQQGFEQFAANNPWITQELIRVARYYQRIGRNRCGMKHLIEVMRYEYAKRAQNAEDLKINNNYTSRYTRLVCELAPDIAPMFEQRRLRSE